MKKIASFLLLPLLVSCNSVEITKETPDINHVQTLSKFKIILRENHAEGYSWHLNQTYNTNIVNYVNSAWHGDYKGVYFYFKTLSKGKTELTFVKRKYTDTTEIKTFIIEVAGE